MIVVGFLSKALNKFRGIKKYLDILIYQALCANICGGV